MIVNISSIIFDLDGTLLDTLAGLTEATNYVMQEFNFPSHSKNEVRNFVGNGMQKLLERAAPHDIPETIFKECCECFQNYYSENWQSKCCPYDGINDMLAVLHKKSVPLAILSNKPHQYTRLFAEHFFPADIFHLVYGQREGFGKKPQPDVALEIAKKLKIEPEETLFMGDSGVDIETGKNAGMRTAAVSWGFRSKEELVEKSPDILLNHPSELFDYVLFAR